MVGVGIIVTTTQSFAGAFYLSALIYLIGLVCYVAMASGERQF